MAALDALVHRSVAAFADTASTSALADRVDPAALAKGGGRRRPPREGARARRRTVRRRPDRDRAARARRAPRRRGRRRRHARALRLRSRRARHRPRRVDAGEQRRRRDAALDVAGTPIPAEIAGPGPFVTKLAPAAVRALGCTLPLYAQSNVLGVRDVVVDVDVPKAGWIGLGLRSSSAATVRAGGQLAIERPHALGSAFVSRFSQLEVDRPGTLRIVARVGMNQDFESVETRRLGRRGQAAPRARSVRRASARPSPSSASSRRRPRRRGPTTSSSRWPSARSPRARAAPRRTSSSRSPRAPIPRPSSSSPMRERSDSRATSRR